MLCGIRARGGRYGIPRIQRNRGAGGPGGGLRTGAYCQDAVIRRGDARIANPKFKAQFGCKPRMLPAEEAEERIGHAVGGVCPFAVNEGCDVYLDESLRRFDVVYPACGSSNSAIALTLDELAAYTPGSIWVDVCKLPE